MLVAVLFAIFGALAFLTGVYFSTRAFLSQRQLFEGLGNESILGMSILSVIVGYLFITSAGRLWRGRELAWELSVGAAVFALVASLGVQLAVTTGVVMIGVSWIVTAVSAVALAVLLLPGIRGYPRRRAEV